jgi:guanylate kinase
MTKGDLFTISAPSGAGKTRLVHALIAHDLNLVLSVSHTTRSIRPGESDGNDYHFVNRDEFTQLVKKGLFLEHAEVFGNLYGTTQKAVDNKLSEGFDVLLEIDWQGAAQIRRLRSDVVAIFILPPSREVLQQRLTSRGQDSGEVIAQRMASAKNEVSHYAEADYLVINDDFDDALEDTLAIIRARRLMQSRQARNQAELISSLLA